MSAERTTNVLVEELKTKSESEKPALKELIDFLQKNSEIVQSTTFTGISRIARTK